MKTNNGHAVFTHKADLVPRGVKYVPTRTVKCDDTILRYKVAHAYDGAVHLCVLEGELVSFPISFDVSHIDLAFIGDERPIGAFILKSLSLSLTLAYRVLWKLFGTIGDIGLRPTINHTPLPAGNFFRRQD